MIQFETLSTKINNDLSENYLTLLGDLLADPETPFIRFILYIIRDRQGFRLGFKKTGQVLLLELGASLKFGIGNPAEMFMCDTAVIEDRRDQVKAVVEKLLSLFEDFGGHKVNIVLSWKTGALPERLSSMVTAAEYIHPDYRRGSGRKCQRGEHIFCHTYAKIIEDNGRLKVHHMIRLAVENGWLLILDRNESNLFPNGKLERILVHEYGFEVGAKVFGDEVIIYVHPTARIALVRPFSITGDSRPEIRVEASIRRAMAIEVPASIVAYIKGKPATTYEGGKLNILLACSILK